MPTISIYNPQVRAYAERHGITDLQAYRALNSREAIKDRLYPRPWVKPLGLTLSAEDYKTIERY